MADFCTQCSFLMFGWDSRDLACITPPKNGYVAFAVCEGCGPIHVDINGTCQTHTHEQHRRMWRRE